MIEVLLEEDMEGPVLYNKTCVSVICYKEYDVCIQQWILSSCDYLHVESAGPPNEASFVVLVILSQLKKLALSCSGGKRMVCLA